MIRGLVECLVFSCSLGAVFGKKGFELLTELLPLLILKDEEWPFCPEPVLKMNLHRGEAAFCSVSSNASFCCFAPCSCISPHASDKGTNERVPELIDSFVGFLRRSASTRDVGDLNSVDPMALAAPMIKELDRFASLVVC